MKCSVSAASVKSVVGLSSSIDHLLCLNSHLDLDGKLRTNALSSTTVKIHDNITGYKRRCNRTPDSHPVTPLIMYEYEFYIKKTIKF